MPPSKNIRLNALPFLLHTIDDCLHICLWPTDSRIKATISDRNPVLLSALEQLVKDACEIESVVAAEDNFLDWLQTFYAYDEQSTLQILIDSQYATQALKQLARSELAQKIPGPFDQKAARA
jgi:hypothetical protein